MLNAFIADRKGNFALTLSVLTVPLLLGIGFGIDYSRLLSARSYLQEITDGTSLALAISGEKDVEKLKKQAGDFIAGNQQRLTFKDIKVASLVSNDDGIDLKLQGKLDTMFMGLANISTMDVEATALAKRAVTGSVEVALVLDNTESMNYDNKIATLKTAATNLVTQLTSNKDANVRISLVPYAELINVGLANRKASWISVPEDYSDTVTTTTTKTTEDAWVQKTKKAVPNKCLNMADAYTKTVEKDGVMVTTSYPAACTEWEMVNDGPPVFVPGKTTTTTTNTTTTYAWYGCVGMRVSGGKLVLNDGSPTVKYQGLPGKNKAFKCMTEIVPLTKDSAKIKTAIAGMITSRTSPTYTPNTYIPGGLMWGINVLSKTEPFSEGEDYDKDGLNIAPRKVIVLMTDGLNTMRTNVTGKLNTDYLKSGSFIGDTASANDAQRTATDTDTKTLCTYAKTNKIEIFTVAFKVDDTDAKAMLEVCATDKDHYYDASDPEKLLAAFSGIAQSLTQVRLAR